MSQDTRDVLISISRRRTALSEVANEILDGIEETPQYHPDIIALCSLLHMPPTNDAAKIAGLVIPRLHNEVDDQYSDFIESLPFDVSKANDFYDQYMETLNMKGVATSSVNYMFGVGAVFNKSPEENYGCARALIELYGDDESPVLWRNIILMKGRVIDVD